MKKKLWPLGFLGFLGFLGYLPGLNGLFSLFSIFSLFGFLWPTSHNKSISSVKGRQLVVNRKKVLASFIITFIIAAIITLPVKTVDSFITIFSSLAFSTLILIASYERSSKKNSFRN